MKSRLVLLLAASALSLSAGVVKNSKHDLSFTSTAQVKTSTATQTQVCAFCHTPHSGSGKTLAPLWNKSLTTATVFTAYGTTSAGTVVSGTPTGASLVCYICHDGTMSIGTQVNVPNDAASAPAFAALAGRVTAAGLLDPANPSRLTGDMTKDHPVTVPYPASSTGAFISYVPIATVRASTAVKLFSDTVQCASCHDTHDPQYGSFLRSTNTGSALCITCHAQ